MKLRIIKKNIIKNKDEILEHNKEYRELNKDKLKTYRELNKNSINNQQNKYKK